MVVSYLFRGAKKLVSGQNKMIDEVLPILVLARNGTIKQRESDCLLNEALVAIQSRDYAFPT